MPDDQTKSRLTGQLVALGLEDAARAEAATVSREKRLMTEVEPLPLTFPPQKSPRSLMAQWRVAVPVLAAAAVALILFKPWSAEDPGWRVKGAGHVEVYADVGGNVIKLERGATLPNGAKVRAQVTAAADIVAFSGIVNARRELLSDPASVWSGRLTLKPGDKAFFAGSVELVGADEGEAAVVVSCPASVIANAGPDFSTTVQNIMKDGAAGLTGCDVFSQSLR
jgi:hypothetical protein